MSRDNSTISEPNSMWDTLFGAPHRGRPLDIFFKNIQDSLLTGEFTWRSLTNEDSTIIAAFKDGQLHCDNGEAWCEYYNSDRQKRAWALNGVVLAIDDDGFRQIYRNGTFEHVARIDFAELGITESKSPLTGRQPEPPPKYIM
jgi:hypothetical protein